MIYWITFWILFNAFDVLLYVQTINKVGALNNLWPGSGFYVAWKHRNKDKP